MLKSAGALTPRAQGASRQLRRRRAAHARPRRHEPDVAPPILSALGASQATLRAAILDRYRQAS